PSDGILGYPLRPAHADAGDLVDRSQSSSIQHSSYLSARRRTDSAFATLVPAGTRPQPDGGDHHRLSWRIGDDRARAVYAIGVVWAFVRLHPDELLGRLEAGPSLGAIRQAAAAGRISLAQVPECTAPRGILRMQSLRPVFRPLCHAGHLSELPEQILRNSLPRLRSGQSDGSVDVSGLNQHQVASGPTQSRRTHADARIHTQRVLDLTGR